jgi:Cof subfamily protein (haloacid dehalogenase superfamily)
MMIISQNHQLSPPPDDKPPAGLFIMDFDGTLLRSDRTFSGIDIDALERLGKKGIIRTIATGRSLYSFNTVAVSDLPVDFVIFSTGTGVLQQDEGKIIRSVSLESHEVERICDVLRVLHLDFMIHRIIPDNHMFAYFRSNNRNPDFERRIALYRQFTTDLRCAGSVFGPAAQVLAVVSSENAAAALEKCRNALTDFNVIQTTSPLDGKSTWIEIFPRAVSKSLTAAWLARSLGIDRKSIVSVGNDYNDLDLLEWTDTSYVVGNAPRDLKSRFTGVASNDNGGVAEAARRWLEDNFGDW